jgi:hypothetical protein
MQTAPIPNGRDLHHLVMIPPAACPCHQDMVGATQQKEQEFAEAASGLAEKQDDWRLRSDAAQAAARQLRATAAVWLNRHALEMRSLCVCWLPAAC